jgi:hypothetical protein
MPTPEEVKTRLRLVWSRCQPNDFDELFELATEFSQLCILSGELDDPLDARLKVSKTFHLLITAINESYVTGLFESDNTSNPNAPDDSDDFELKRALRTAESRLHFLGVVVLSAAAFLNSYLLKTHRRGYWINDAWPELIAFIRQMPTLAPLATQLDTRELSQYFDESTGEFLSTCREREIVLVDIEGSILRAEILAWGTLLQVPRAPNDEKLALLQSGAARLRLLLNFMLVSEGRPWQGKELFDLDEKSSLSQIVRELHSYRLELLDESHPSYSVLTDLRGCWLYSFKRGMIRKSTYVVTPPDYFRLCEKPLFSEMAEQEDDPWRFTYSHLAQIPTSFFVQQIQSELGVVDEIILGIRLEHWLLARVEELSPEFLALGVVESLHLPHLCAPFLTAIFHRLFRLFRSRDGGHGPASDPG